MDIDALFGRADALRACSDSLLGEAEGIKLFVDQIRAGCLVRVANSFVTRFLMGLEYAVP